MALKPLPVVLMSTPILETIIDASEGIIQYTLPHFGTAERGNLVEFGV
jgi:hypothetical protein